MSVCVYKCRKAAWRDRTSAAPSAILSIADRQCTRNKASVWFSFVCKRDLTASSLRAYGCETLFSHLCLSEDRRRSEEEPRTKMVRKVYHVVLIVALLASARLGASAPDWVSELVHNLNTMAHNIEYDVQRLTQNLDSQIQNSVRPALEEVNRAIENLPRDAQGRIITNGNIITSNGGNAISITSTNGGSKIVMSGYTSDGEPYVRTIEERNDGHYLEHNEISFNPKTNATERIHWKLDLTTPGAKPEIITDEE